MELNPKYIYIQACADRLRAMYPGPVLIRITAPGHPAHYPAGTWFDDRVGALLVPAGIDPDAIPPVYIMANGDAIPTSCAELIQVSQIIQAIQDALAQAFRISMDTLLSEIRRAADRSARKERRRRRYQRMMERGRARR